MFSRLAVTTGWTLTEIRSLSYQDFMMVSRYFDEVPPMHVLAAAYLGAIKEPKKAPACDGELARIAAAHGIPVRRKSHG